MPLASRATRKLLKDTDYCPSELLFFFSFFLVFLPLSGSLQRLSPAFCEQKRPRTAVKEGEASLGIAAGRIETVERLEERHTKLPGLWHVSAACLLMRRSVFRWAGGTLNG